MKIVKKNSASYSKGKPTNQHASLTKEAASVSTTKYLKTTFASNLYVSSRYF